MCAVRMDRLEKGVDDPFLTPGGSRLVGEKIACCAERSDHIGLVSLRGGSQVSFGIRKSELDNASADRPLILQRSDEKGCFPVYRRRCRTQETKPIQLVIPEIGQEARGQN